MTPPKRRARPAAAAASAYATVDDLPTVQQEDVTLSNGKVFQLRGLTVGEVRDALLAADDMDGVDARAAITAACTVDPKITPEQMAAWINTAVAGDARTMIDAAERLCGLGEGATKSRVPAHRNGRPSSE